MSRYCRLVARLYFKNSEVPFRLHLLCRFQLMKWKLSQGWMFEHQCVVKSKLDGLKGLWWAVDQNNIRNQCLLHHTVNAPWNILYSNIKCTQYEIRPFNHNSWSMSLSFVQFYYVTYISNCVRFPHRQMQIANLVNLQPEYANMCFYAPCTNWNSSTFSWILIVMAIKL